MDRAVLMELGRNHQLIRGLGMLISLMYYSKVVVGVRADGIATILRSARKNNPNEDLTGVLYTNGRWFLQILEGPRESVTRMFGILQNDNRHTSVTMINVKNIEVRAFGDWGMAFIKNDPAVTEIIKEMTGMEVFDPSWLDYDQAYALLKRLGDERLQDLVPRFC